MTPPTFDTYTAFFGAFVVVGEPRKIYRPFARGISEALEGAETRAATHGHTNIIVGGGRGLPSGWSFQVENVVVLCNRSVENLDEMTIRVGALKDFGTPDAKTLPETLGREPWGCEVSFDATSAMHDAPPQSRRGQCDEILARVTARAPASSSRDRWSLHRLGEDLKEVCGRDVDARPAPLNGKDETTFWVVMEGPASMPVV